MQPSDFVTYRVSKKLFDLNIISRETFLSFATEFAKLIKSLRKEGDTAVDWDAVREMFDFDDYADVVPINAANLCPSIHNVQVFVNQMGIDMNKDVSIQKRTSVFATIIDFSRALIANRSADLTGATTDQEVIDRFVAAIKPGITRVVTYSEVG